MAAEEFVAFEAAKDTAEVAGVQVEAFRDLAGGGVGRGGNLEEDAGFREVPLGAEVAGFEAADSLGVEAIEGAELFDEAILLHGGDF